MNVRDRAKKLIALASDPQTTDGERAGAALQAVRLIHEHDLLSSPLDNLLPVNEEKVRAVRDVIDSAPELFDNLKTLFSGLSEGVKKQHRQRRSRKRTRM